MPVMPVQDLDTQIGRLFTKLEHEHNTGLLQRVETLQLRAKIEGWTNQLLAHYGKEATQKAVMDGLTEVRFQVNTSKAAQGLWAKLGAQVQGQISVEMLARAMEIFLLDAGFSVENHTVTYECRFAIEEEVAEEEIPEESAEVK